MLFSLQWQYFHLQMQQALLEPVIEGTGLQFATQVCFVSPIGVVLVSKKWCMGWFAECFCYCGRIRLGGLVEIFGLSAAELQACARAERLPSRLVLRPVLQAYDQDINGSVGQAHLQKTTCVETCNVQ